MDAGAEEEFRRFVQARWHALVRTAYLLTGDRGRAEDLVQQTLVKVHRRWSHIASAESPYAYTRAALANESASWWRRRRVAEALGDLPAHADRDPATTTGTSTPVTSWRALRESVAQQLGLAAGQLVTATRYSGPVDAAVAAASGVTDATSAATTHSLYVGDTTLPGGGVVRTALLVSSFGGGTGSSTELAGTVPIDASTAANRPVVVGGLRQPGRGAILEVFAPGAAAVQLVSSAPTLWPDSARVPVTAGWARVNLDDAQFRQHYTVEVYDASGRSLGTFPVDLPNANDPLDLQPGG
jgi:DNA-directed RNA polymerase specialized sigma24 family protein